VNIDHFGMDTATLAGPLEAKLHAIRDAGFTQVMLSAPDIAGHPGGATAAVKAVRDSGLRITGLQHLCDFEGLSGHLHAYKIDVAKAMLAMCRSIGCRLLVACSSTSAHASGDFQLLKKDLQQLAMLGVPLDVRIAYEALSWGRYVSDVAQAAEIVEDANRSNLGLAIDSFHLLASGGDADSLEAVDPGKVFLVQLSDFMWQEMRSPRDRIETAQHQRVFPGEGAHGGEIADLVRRLDDIGYRGHYSFEVFNDDYRQLPPPIVASRARRAAKWVTDHVSRRSLPMRHPLPGPRR
jgi:sugar phosphate isomerase/epimerase